LSKRGFLAHRNPDAIGKWHVESIGDANAKDPNIGIVEIQFTALSGIVFDVRRRLVVDALGACLQTFWARSMRRFVAVWWSA
jgi:hypothetical protein